MKLITTNDSNANNDNDNDNGNETDNDIDDDNNNINTDKNVDLRISHSVTESYLLQINTNAILKGKRLADKQERRSEIPYTYLLIKLLIKLPNTLMMLLLHSLTKLLYYCW